MYVPDLFHGFVPTSDPTLPLNVKIFVDVRREEFHVAAVFNEIVKYVDQGMSLVRHSLFPSKFGVFFKENVDVIPRILKSVTRNWLE